MVVEYYFQRPLLFTRIIRAQNWITFCDPDTPARGIPKQKVLTCVARTNFLFDCSLKQASVALQ